MNTLTILIRDEINCTLKGIEDSHIEALKLDHRFRTENYIFHPKYKLGIWDGYVHFVHKNGATFIYLLPQIIPKLLQWGYDIEVKDFRIPGLTTPPPITELIFSDYVNGDGDPYIMRDYQIELVNTLILAGSGIALAGTASGKSIMGAAIAKSYETAGLRTIIIVPSTVLVSQLYGDFINWGMNCGRLGGKVRDLDHTHLITTWQSLQNIPTILTDYDVLVVDECQGAKALVLSNMLKNEGKRIKYRFGLTGTMPKNEMDIFQINLTLGDIIYKIPASDLIKRGVLSTVHINMLELVEPYDENHFPDYASEVAYLRGNKDRNKWIANSIISTHNTVVGPNGETTPTNLLALVTSIAVGKMLTKLIPDSHFVYGADEVEVRMVIYNLFKDHDNITVITTAQIGGVGLSIDRVFYLVMVDIGKSFVRVIQGIGRGLRKNVAGGKTHCVVYDIGSNLKYSKLHNNKRKEFYIESEYPHSIDRITNYSEKSVEP